MSLSGSLIAIFIGVAIIQDSTNEVKDSDYGRFQGEWRIVSVECGGKNDNQDIAKYTIKFDGNTLIVRACDGEGVSDGADEAAVRFNLREGRCSRHITFGGVSGIYDFKDDNLLICYSLDGDESAGLRTTADRPEEVLMTLTRIGQR